MNKKNLVGLGVGAVLILLLASLGWQLLAGSALRQPLAEAAARELVLGRFGGEIVEAELTDRYSFTLKRDSGRYLIEIDSQSGDILEIIELEEATAAQSLSEEQVIALIASEQPGEIKELKRRTSEDVVFYDARVEDDRTKTSVTVNSETAEITTNQVEEKPPVDAPVRRITKAQAVEIALGAVQGDVDDVDLEEHGGQLYYFVEIEVHDDLEANVQINAITGDIKSIEWDD